MARKRHSDEDVLKLLREIELKLAAGDDVASACRSVGISDATYYNWRKRFGGMGRAQLSEMKGLQKENARLKKIVAELERRIREYSAGRGRMRGRYAGGIGGRSDRTFGA